MYEDILYTRVSGHFQATQGVSLEQQDLHLKEWSVRNGGHVTGFFEERGKSGRSIKGRVQLIAALALLKPKSRFIVSKLSRLGRNVKEVLQIAETIKCAGASLIIVDQTIDTSTAIGQLFFTMLAAVAQFESDMLAEQINQMVTHQRSKGKVWGGTPFGWQRQSDKSLVPNEAERALWLEVKRLKNAGHSNKQIEADFKRRGHFYDAAKFSNITKLDFNNNPQVYNPPKHYLQRSQRGKK
ncbi:DNA-invertase hin [Ephemeroptericola cinctiostellae]|uniref:DNA-invertase hin n=1 Tax=Ephemeroptericola cinctiostellae TaxID=2268024 RepID=A0A345DE96_9BURK|nr:recombinase family protein [Ephemeroptericola cinctiostellae]AXF86684.1 DNA-invertase hin [Ephemeroptericola cinctiostellae]